ncbi:primary-amine oxidase, partial [Mycobacterium kansasii]
LSADEIRAVTALLAREHGVNADWRYASIEMFEPSKAEITAFDTDGTPAERVAVAVLFDRTANRTYKARVSLTADAVTAFDHVPDVQANVTVDEWDEA